MNRSANKRGTLVSLKPKVHDEKNTARLQGNVRRNRRDVGSPGGERDFLSRDTHRLASVRTVIFGWLFVLIGLGVLTAGMWWGWWNV